MGSTGSRTRRWDSLGDSKRISRATRVFSEPIFGLFENMEEVLEAVLKTANQ
ncbi:hypothetical protein T23_10240 [Turicibacter faecis]|uniref:Uncharacterized protein n=1 Tax=Turicibacter faecis TaxID=2963365 RepID=A0ABN6ZAQ3_9FIRM|nr:hypothetical protein T23_10240 [Turicibacter sp. TC023]